MSAVGINIGVNISGRNTSSGDLSSRAEDFGQAFTKLFQSGTGSTSGNADQVFSDTRTLAASANETLDLNGTALTDAFGAAIAMVRVKAIYIKAAAANTNDVVIGGGSNPFVGPWGGTTTVSVKPGDFVLITNMAAGWTVTAATGDLLKIANSSSGTGVDYDIIIVGATA